MKKVLIIDDERDARLLIRQYLGPLADFIIIGECSKAWRRFQISIPWNQISSFWIFNARIKWVPGSSTYGTPASGNFHNSL